MTKIISVTLCTSVNGREIQSLISCRLSQLFADNLLLTLSCSMFLGVFITKGDVGVGTIVGSAVFNVLVIIGICGIFSGQVNAQWSHLQLNGGPTKYFLNNSGINDKIRNIRHKSTFRPAGVNPFGPDFVSA